MDFDFEHDRIITNADEREALRTHEDVEWAISTAWKLFELAEFELSRVEGIDPSATALHSARNKLITEKFRHSRVLRNMLDELLPFVTSGIGDEAEDYLKDR